VCVRSEKETCQKADVFNRSTIDGIDYKEAVYARSLSCCSLLSVVCEFSLNSRRDDWSFAVSP